MIELEKVKNLLLLGLITGLFFGILSADFTATVRITIAYLLVVYLPGLFWVGFSKRSLIERYVLLNLFGLVATPFLLYVVSFLGVPINEITVFSVFPVLLFSGFIRYKKFVSNREINAPSSDDRTEQ